MWSRDVSRDITPLLMSILPSKGPDVGCTRGVSNLGVVVGYMADPPFSAPFVWVVAMHLNMSGTIAKDTLDKLGASFCWMSCSRAPSTGGMLIVWAVFPPIGEVGDASVKHGMGDVGGDGCIMEDAWLELSVCIGAGQCMERVVLLPSCVPIELLEPC